MTQTESIFDRKPTGRGVFQIEPMNPQYKSSEPNFLDHLVELFGAPFRICDEPDPTFEGTVISWDEMASTMAEYERTHGPI